MVRTNPVAELAFGPYVAARMVGQGAMGIVYEARHPDRADRFAVKAMNTSLTGDAVAVERFLREAQALAEVSHPHIVRIEDSGVDGGRPYIVMNFVEGESLAVRLARGGRLTPAEIAHLFLPIISAVSCLHARRIVHRDLKPANVMLRDSGGGQPEPVLLDLGISRIDEVSTDDSGLTRSEALLGTLQYLSPEQLRSAKWASALSDQYALGVMLYECATGRRPFSGGSHYDLMHAIITSPVPPPSSHASGLPPEFDALVLRAMRREPGRRFPNVRVLGSALLSFADKETWARWGAEFTGVVPLAEEGPPAETELDSGRGFPALGAAEASALAPQRRAPRTRTTVAFVAGLAVSAGAALYLASGKGPPAAPVEQVRAAPPPETPRPPAPALVPAPPPLAEVVDPPPAAPAPPAVKQAGRRQPGKVKASPARPAKPHVPSSLEELGDDDVFDPFPPARPAR